MNIKKLRTFAALVEHGSYTKAGHALGISQPAVTVHIKTLEEKFQTKLINKTDTSYIPTQTGNEVYKYARQITELYDECLEKLNLPVED